MGRVWLIAGLAALACFGQVGLPDDMSAVVEGDWVRIRSSGISTTWFGRLATPPVPADGRLRVDVRIPARPVAADVSKRTAVPIRYSGVFRNGTPIWNQVEVASFEGRNIWHYDLVNAAARSGHGVSSGMLEALVEGDGKASSIVGFALDGYPVYGPWAEVDGRARRMRSGYQVRKMARRVQLPDGTKLTPGQYGPDVDERNPLGTFAEDYEYVAGSGDLDECNGRFVTTAEFPGGTYAYFLSTDEAGGFAYPYLIGPRFHGVYAPPVTEEVRDFRLGGAGQAATVSAGVPVRLRFRAGVRHLERVHEKPLHLMVVSEDLKVFDHIHPELTAGKDYEVVHTFRRGGRYRLFADYVVPGGTPQVQPIDLIAVGSGDGPVSRFEVGEAELDRPKVVRVDEDVNLRLRLRSVEGLQPFLGAWAHFVIVSADLGSFIHAHPIDPDGSLKTESGIHVHGTDVLTGPVPSEIRTVTSFHRPGRYRIWAQLQRAGRVMTVPFDLDVAEAAATGRSGDEVQVPDGAVRVKVSRGGFEPASVLVPAGRPFVLAVSRDMEPNCGGEIVFPGLGVRKVVGLGQTVVVELPARESGTELRFTCGMGMYRGLVVVR